MKLITTFTIETSGKKSLQLRKEFSKKKNFKIIETHQKLFFETEPKQKKKLNLATTLFILILNLKTQFILNYW